MTGSPALPAGQAFGLSRAPITLGLILANLALFLVMAALGGGFWQSSQSGLQLAWGANFAPATQDGQWWRLGSALFIHFGLLHLGTNMVALWDAGQLLERSLGHARFLGLYLLAGLTGNLASLAAHGNQAVSGGASGAIFGVYGALVVALWLQRKHLSRQEFRWMFWSALLFTAISAAFGFLVPGIDNAAHLAGLAAGALLCLILFPGPRDRLVWRLSAGALLAAAVAGLISHLPAPTYRWSHEQQARAEIRAFAAEDATLAQRWALILDEGRRGHLSFEQLADRLDRDIGIPYSESFSELSRLPNDPAMPSAPALNTLRDYAELRRDAARTMADGLRQHNPRRIREGLNMAEQAKHLVKPEGKGKP